MRGTWTLETGFGGDLQFRVLWRMFKNNAPYMPWPKVSLQQLERRRTFEFALEADISMVDATMN